MPSAVCCIESAIMGGFIVEKEGEYSTPSVAAIIQVHEFAVAFTSRS